MIVKKNLLFSALALLFLWVVWIIAYYAVGNAFLVPSIGDTFSALGEYLASGAFWTAFSRTLLRTVLSFLISLLLGVGLAALAVNVKWVRAFLAPVISVLRTLPTMAIILILLLWTSPSVAPVIVTLLVLFPAVYAAALAALDDVKGEFSALVQAYGVSKGRQLVQMYLPLVAPNLLKQSGGIFSMGLKVTVSGEVLASTARSIGGLMQDARIAHPAHLMALTLVTVLLGFLLEGACLLAYKLIVRWKR